MDWTEILKIAGTQGIWALLFVYMLWYVLKENGERESKYQNIIENLTNKFEVIEKGIEDINDKIEKIGK